MDYAERAYLKYLVILNFKTSLEMSVSVPRNIEGKSVEESNYRHSKMVEGEYFHCSATAQNMI